MDFFQIFTVYALWVDAGLKGIFCRSEIQYGRQAAIFVKKWIILGFVLDFSGLTGRIAFKFSQFMPCG